MSSPLRGLGTKQKKPSITEDFFVVSAQRVEL